MDKKSDTKKLANLNLNKYFSLIEFILIYTNIETDKKILKHNGKSCIWNNENENQRLISNFFN